MDYSDERAWESLAAVFLGGLVARPTMNCGLVHCEPGWRWEPTLDDFDLWVVMSGRGTAVIDGQHHRLSPGTAMVLPPGLTGRFEQDPDDGLSVVYCHFTLHDASSTDPLQVTSGGTPYALDARLLPSPQVDLDESSSVITQMRALVRLAHDRHPWSAVQRSHLLLTILIEIYRLDAAALGHAIVTVDPRIDAVVMLIRAHPGRRLSLAMAARRASLSEQHFSRLFRSETGTSFRDFCLEARLERGRELLTESTMTVTEIARALGYPELYPFSRQIRARFGVPPTGLRGGARRR